MTNTRIADAWGRFQTQNHMKPAEVHQLIQKVVTELAEAAFGETVARNQTTEFTHREKFRLTSRFTVHRPPGEETEGEGMKSSFRMETIREEGTESLTVTLEAHPFAPPKVSDPVLHPEMRTWNKEDGDQTEWALDCLRRQVADFLDRQRQWT